MNEEAMAHWEEGAIAPKTNNQTNKRLQCCHLFNNTLLDVYYTPINDSKCFEMARTCKEKFMCV
jgi:hypothetical protein